MLAPNPRRPLSRSSIATTFIDSSPPSSSSDYNAPRSSRTSMTSDNLSDHGTEMPEGSEKDLESVTAEGRDVRPLIDFGDDEIQSKISLNGSNSREVVPTPGDKLRMLLRQMELEVRDTATAPAPVPTTLPASVSPVPNAPKSSWRSGRRIGLIRAQHSDDVSEHGDDEQKRGQSSSSERDDVSEDDSPPTPPIRITNPYHSRRTSDKQRSSSPPSVHRLPSRAAVLRNSTSSNRSSSPVSDRPTQQTPLETFIATHPGPSTSQAPSDPSSSRSYDRSNSSSSSRKGKERAISTSSRSPVAPSPPIRNSNTYLSQQGRRIAHTPRRFSVELAPDDSGLFAQEAGALEVRGEVEFDIEESSGEPPWDGDFEESTIEEPPPEHRVSFEDKTERTERTVRARNTSRSYDTSRLNNNTRHSTPSISRLGPTEETSLPALPEPSVDGSDEDDEPALNTLSSRQASLFRSPSKLSPRQSSASQSYSRSISRHSVSPNLSRVRAMEIPQQEPIRVGMVQISTPPRTNPSTTAGLTPHPPGRWYSPAKTSSGHQVSPPHKSTTPNSHAGQSRDGSGEVSIHRLKLSPSKPPAKSPQKKAGSPLRNDGLKADEKDQDGEEGNSSFLGRIPGLSRIIPTRTNIPPASKTLQEARDALAFAAKTSAAARVHVEQTQRQWLEALAAVQSVNSAVGVVKRGWGWGSWAWWVGMEMLLVWGVFRVTLDYASSAQYISSIDPFSLQSGSSLSIPLPSAISTFIVPHRGSANFFDLLDRADLWRRLDDLGILSVAGGVEGVGGVVGQGVRGLGGVPT